MQMERWSSLSWNVEPRNDSALSPQEQQRYRDIVASYGGTGDRRREFRRYRVAELCARSIRSALGVETTIDLRPSHS
jgi:hypothetical protein